MNLPGPSPPRPLILSKAAPLVQPRFPPPSSVPIPCPVFHVNELGQELLQLVVVLLFDGEPGASVTVGRARAWHAPRGFVPVPAALDARRVTRDLREQAGPQALLRGGARLAHRAEGHERDERDREDSAVGMRHHQLFETSSAEVLRACLRVRVCGNVAREVTRDERGGGYGFCCRFVARQDHAACEKCWAPFFREPRSHVSQVCAPTYGSHWARVVQNTRVSPDVSSRSHCRWRVV